MRATKWLFISLFASFPASAVLGGCSSSTESTGADDQDLVNVPDLDLAMVAKLDPSHERPDFHRLLRNAPPVPTNLSQAPSPQLSFRGGPMLENVQVHTVFWGDGVPQETQKSLTGFFKAVAGNGSPYYAMLSEYNTTQPPQTINFGTFNGAFVDHDAPASKTVTDAQIQAEVARLIDLEKVPQNDGHNIFMVYFPPGVQIDQGGGSLSCEVFCAYHGSFTRNGNEVYYGVMPDLSSGGCENGCGFNATPLENLYSVSTHELVEATTDAAVGDGNLAWYDDANGEIGDICYMFPDGKVRGYAVQTEWSNQDRGCRFKPSTANVTIDATPAEATLAAGQPVEFLVTAAGNLNKKTTLKTLRLPKGVTATFDPPAIKPGQYSKLTLTAAPDALASASSFILFGADANGAFHYVSPKLTVQGIAPAVGSIDTPKGPSQGGTTVTIAGGGFGRGARVTFGDVGAQVVGAASDGTSLTVLTPSHVTGVVDLAILNADGKSVTSARAFEFTAGAPPTVTKISPPGGPLTGGQFVLITGTNFGADDQGAVPTVTIGGQRADSFAMTNLIYALTPAGTAGAADVVVTNGDGQSGTLAQAFTYGTNAPPALDPLTVGTGAVKGGTYLTLTGSFDAQAKVTFDGKEATVTTRNPSFVGLLTPAHPAGAVDVTVVNSDGQTASAKAAFTYK